MATLGSLKARLASDFNRADLTDAIDGAIADAIAEYQSRRFHFNQARDTFETTADTEFYGTDVIPADIAEIDALTVTVDGRRVRLIPWSFSVGEGVNAISSTATGHPLAWSWYAEQIRLYPIPDATYTVTISYLQKIDAPASDGASNAWTGEAERLIRACAAKIIWRDKVRNQAQAAASEAEEMRQLRKLRREANKLDTGCLAGSGF